MEYSLFSASLCTAFRLNVCFFFQVHYTRILASETPERTADACMTGEFAEFQANPVLRISSEQTLEK